MLERQIDNHINRHLGLRADVELIPSIPDLGNYHSSQSAGLHRRCAQVNECERTGSLHQGDTQVEGARLLSARSAA